MGILQPSDWDRKKTFIQERLKKLSVDELRELLASKLSATADSLLESALIMRELEEVHGIDMQPIVASMASILRKIAYGQLLAEAVVYCGSNEKLLHKVASLPVPDQKRLIESDGFEFAEGDDHRVIDPRNAQPWQLKQLFAADHVRPLHEQRQWLSCRPQPSRRRFKPTVTCASEVSEEEMNSIITVAVTPEWDTAIRIMAKENGWPVKYAATRFLISLGKKSSS